MDPGRNVATMYQSIRLITQRSELDSQWSLNITQIHYRCRISTFGIDDSFVQSEQWSVINTHSNNNENAHKITCCLGE